MIKLCQYNKEKVLSAIKAGKIEGIESSYGNFIDEIILTMKRKGITSELSESIEDKRSEKNSTIPHEILLLLSIAAKMKIKTAMTDIPYAITEAETLSELGWNIHYSNRDIEEGIVSEGAIRNYIKNYVSEEKAEEYKTEFIEMYNRYVSKIKRKLDIEPYIHILDCTEEEVNLSNENYEKSGVIKDSEGVRRGYKLGTLRGLLENSGIIEEVVMSSIERHDLKVCEDMLKKSEHLRTGDILINDRGFISRELLNYLKTEKGVDVYVPAKANMDIYAEAVSIATMRNKWQKHPNPERKTQKIAFVEQLGSMWQSENPAEDVEINVCVVHDEKAKTKDKEFFVFMTTDTSATSRQIIKTYELRPEIEEDYRQLKDFWQIEDFRSTKYLDITFHNVMLLIGYFYFQLFKEMEEGRKYAKKSLPVIIKNYVVKKKAVFVIYSGMFFAVFGFLEIMQLYSSLSPSTKKKLDIFFASV